MNRVYKIVWSKAKNAYVVTSELAKNHTKNASGKMVKAALAAAMGNCRTAHLLTAIWQKPSVNSILKSIG